MREQSVDQVHKDKNSRFHGDESMPLTYLAPGTVILHVSFPAV